MHSRARHHGHCLTPKDLPHPDSQGCACVPAGSSTIDVQQPGAAVGEAALLMAPIAALQTRLHELLAEWPDNPLLTQLLAICDRIQGESSTATTWKGTAHSLSCQLAQ